jgi:hypothetical protein
MFKRSVALFQIGLFLSLTLSTAEFVSGVTPTPTPTGHLPKFLNSVKGTGGEYKFFGSFKDGSTLWQDPAGKDLILKSGELPPGASPAGSDSFTWSKAFGGEAFGGGATGALTQGFLWGATLYLGVKMIGSLVGLNKQTTDALANSVFVGAVGGGLTKAGILQFVEGTKASTAIGGNSWFSSLTPNQAGLYAGVAIAVIVFLVLYKDTKTKVVQYQCLPWEPALGGAKCEECGKDSLQPCSEYRCKSLGQACELVNPGTSEERCIWKSKGDVTSPTITPWDEALKPQGLRYAPLASRPGVRGTRIVTTAGTCLPAYTPLEFGITTNEPAQCKIDFTNGNQSTMQFFFGGNNYYITNHTQKMKLPSATAGDGVVLQNDGTFSLYVKCQDANGNVNDDVYVIEYCVDKGPDTTPPTIMDTSIASGSPVRFGANAVPLDVYVQEPAQCKWSRTSKPYEDMENRFTCASSPTQLNGDLSYTCTGNLTGVQDRAENQFYFRCQDLANNTMVQSYPFILKGSQPLTILETSPNGTLYGATTTVPVTLRVKTDDGAEAGKAICYYSSPTTLGEPIKFFSTESFTHSQQIDVPAGFHQYSLLCVDAGGNTVNSSLNFTMRIDQQAPRVTRVYREEALKVVTDEIAECSYSLNSCNFDLDAGLKLSHQKVDDLTQHYLDWKPSLTYYVKCTDSYGNQPNPTDCSVIVAPKQFLNATKL